MSQLGATPNFPCFSCHVCLFRFLHAKNIPRRKANRKEKKSLTENHLVFVGRPIGLRHRWTGPNVLANRSGNGHHNNNNNNNNNNSSNNNSSSNNNNNRSNNCVWIEVYSCITIGDGCWVIISCTNPWGLNLWFESPICWFENFQKQDFM